MLWRHFFFSKGLRQSKAGQITEFVSINNEEKPSVVSADAGEPEMKPSQQASTTQSASTTSTTLSTSSISSTPTTTPTPDASVVRADNTDKITKSSAKKRDTAVSHVDAPHQERPKKIILQSGKTLRLLAEEIFGSREFWVYFYLENKDKISNPNHVPSGVELIIPNKASYDIDAKSPRSVEKALSRGRSVLREFM